MQHIKKNQKLNFEPVLKVQYVCEVRWGAIRSLIKMILSCPKSIIRALEEILFTTKNLKRSTKIKIGGTSPGADMV